MQHPSFPCDSSKTVERTMKARHALQLRASKARLCSRSAPGFGITTLGAYVKRCVGSACSFFVLVFGPKESPLDLWSWAVLVRTFQRLSKPVESCLRSDRSVGSSGPRIDRTGAFFWWAACRLHSTPCSPFLYSQLKSPSGGLLCPNACFRLGPVLRS